MTLPCGEKGCSMLQVAVSELNGRIDGVEKSDETSSANLHEWMESIASDFRWLRNTVIGLIVALFISGVAAWASFVLNSAVKR